MSRAVRITVVSLALSLLLATGCVESTVSRETIDQTVQTILEANRDVRSATFDLTLTGTILSEEETDTSEVLLTGTGTGAIDNTARRMHLSMTVRSRPTGQAATDLPLEYYLADEWLYMGRCAAAEKPRWLKMRSPTDVWQNQAQQQVEMLRSATEVTYQGIEEVDGAKCYVVTLVPDKATTEQMLRQAYGQLAPLRYHDAHAMAPAGVAGEVSVTQYVATDSLLFVRTDQHMVLEVTPGTTPAEDHCCSRITHRLTTTIVFGNYDEPVTIQLPQGSLAAIEIGQSP